MADPLLPPRLEGHGLVLRVPEPGDVAAITAACQDPEISRWTTVPFPYTTAHAEEFVASRESAAAARTEQDFAVTDAATGELLGMCGVHHVDERAATTQLGYWLAAPARGRGVASAAVSLVAAAVLRAGFERIEAEVLVGNESSRRVLARVGFQEEGVLRSVFADRCGTGAARIDVHLFSLVRRDPAALDLLAAP